MEKKMNKFQIWSEGYIVMGNSAGAQYHGEMEAKTFESACKKFFTSKEHKRYFHNGTYWGCELFDNEQDARKSFG